MAYALIWIESLVVALLLVALVIAWTTRARGRLARVVPAVLIALLPLGLAGLLTVGVGFLYFRIGSMDGSQFAYALSWTIALTIGLAVVLSRGLGTRPADAFAFGVLLLLCSSAALAAGLGFFAALGDLKGLGFLSALALTIVSAIALFWRLHQRGAEEGPPAAQAWSPSRLALALVAMFIVDCITFINMDLAVKVEMASVRAEAGGRALALVPPRVPDRDNAALVYQQAFDVLTPPDKLPRTQREAWFPREWQYSLVGPKFDPKSEDLKNFLDSQRRGLELLRKAAAMPDCWFAHEFHDGMNLRLPQLPQMRDGARLLILNALAWAPAGESQKALGELALVFQMAKHLNDPTLITFLTARFVEINGTKALEEILSRGKLKPEDLAPLAAQRQTPSHHELMRALRMEEAAISAFFATLSEPQSTTWLEKDGGMGAVGMWVLRSSWYRVFFLSADLAAYHRAIRRFQELAEIPYYQANKDLAAFEMAFRRYQGGILTRFVMPAVVKCVTVGASADAARELRRLAIAVTAYRGKNGKFPDRPDALVPEYLAQVPLDPFDGQPLRMKRSGKDLVLYSIGPDLRDDGGTELDPKTLEGDLVFRLRGR
jgi:hypothetical protein